LFLHSPKDNISFIQHQHQILEPSAASAEPSFFAGLAQGQKSLAITKFLSHAPTAWQCSSSTTAQRCVACRVGASFQAVARAATVHPWCRGGVEWVASEGWGRATDGGRGGSSMALAQSDIFIFGNECLELGTF